VVRGGSWNNDPVNLRPANRNRNNPNNRNDNLGVRLVVFAHNSRPFQPAILAACQCNRQSRIESWRDRFLPGLQTPGKY
jgi:hypothetical protein